MGSPRGGGPRQPPAPADWVRRERQGKKDIPPAPPMPPPEPPLCSSRTPSVVDDGASDHYRPPSHQSNQRYASSNGQDTDIRSRHDTLPMHSGQHDSMHEFSQREFDRQASDWQEPARHSSHFDDDALPPPPSRNESVLPLSIRHSGQYDGEFHVRGSEPWSARSSSNFDSLTPTPPPPPQAVSVEYCGSKSFGMARSRYDDPSTTQHSTSSQHDAPATQPTPPLAPVESSASVPLEAPSQHASASSARPITKSAKREDTFDEELKLRVSLGTKAGKKWGRATAVAARATYITPESTVEEVQAWLVAKDFSDRVKGLCKELTGEHMFALTKERLEEVLAATEAARLLSHLTVQKNLCGYKPSGKDQLSEILQMRRNRVDAGMSAFEDAPRSPTTTVVVLQKQHSATSDSKLKRQAQKKRRKEAEALGENAPPKREPRTIENTREPDDTMVQADDEERTIKFCRELKQSIPNTDFRWRNRSRIKKTVEHAIARGYSDIAVINEDRRHPNGLLLTHLPDGPTAYFRISSVKFCKDIKQITALFERSAHVVLFTQGRAAYSAHRRDYIFFRHHRYEFRNAEKVSIQEIGPRFTLRLKSLQKGNLRLQVWRV
ncbi:hypothetical protein HPB51_004415 [Rhipicephalus microplus]|uniref:Brix domain-containing protein n=1 Tax=Rhipicephalus microplus TaxID=6941 RepID=A0A9J6ELE8_RHIMP|nr:hypothetical protein HPB51_004415 [Rhipicephalus microplus]